MAKILSNYSPNVNVFFDLFLNKFRHLRFSVQRSEEVALIRITIPSRECEFPILENKNLLVNLLDIIPTILDWECEELTIDIFTDAVTDGDFFVGDGCDHGEECNSD
jgi:hypothetical protein